MDDPFFQPVEKPQERPQALTPEQSLASPQDRLAAGIIDVCMVMAPLVLLIIAPFRKVMMESLLIHNESRFVVSSVVMVLLGLFAVWIYQSFMHARYGATLGKLLFGLRVVDVHSKKSPGWTASAWRSAFWLVETILIFPHLSVFSHSLRRCWHDRFADTMVVSHRKPVGRPEFWEKAFANGVFAALLAFFLVTSIGIFKGILDDLEDQSKVLSLLEENGELCSAVGNAVRTWPDEKVSYGSERLSVAMAMFAAGIISKTCLAQEADHLSAQLRDEEPLLYLAQSFIHSGNAKLSNEYLDRVCNFDKNSDSCVMSEIINAWSKEDWEEVDELFSKIKGKTTLHIGVWAIRHLMRQKRYFEALTYMESLSPQKTLAPFFNNQRVKALWNLNRFSEARALAMGSLELMDLYDSVDMASWLCSEELEQGCSNTASLSCRTFDNYMKNGKDLLVDSQLALVRVQQLECESEPQENLERLVRDLPQKRIRHYVEGLVRYLDQDPDEAREEMRALMDSSEDDIKWLAQRKLVEWSESEKQLDSYYSSWRSQESGEFWPKLGRSLFNQYYSLGYFGKALEIGRDLLATPVANADFYRKMVLSAYHGGKRKEAAVLLQAYRSMEWNSPETRIPASEEEFQVIARLLEKGGDPK